MTESAGGARTDGAAGASGARGAPGADSGRSGRDAAGAASPPRPRQVALGLCADGGRVLLLRRARAPYAGLWSLPAAGPRAGEGLADACRRAVGLPLGLVPEVVALRLLVAVAPDRGAGAPGGAQPGSGPPAPGGGAACGPPPPAGRSASAPRWVVAVFLCRLPAGTPLPGRAAWLPADALPEGDVMATDRRFVADALSGGPYAVFRRARVRWDLRGPVVLDYA